MAPELSIKFPLLPDKFIKPDEHFFMIGSCFSENIGQKISSSGYEVCLNPFGILYNPVSIGLAIKRILDLELYDANEFIFTHEKRFVSPDHHGKFSGLEVMELHNRINGSLKEANVFLKKQGVVIVTLSTAWIYRYLETGKVVANCHKIPNSNFKKELMTVDEVSIELDEIIKALQKFNPDLKIIFTISPVKHLRDGVLENLRSKSILIVSLMQKLQNAGEGVFYFPSYEIVTEELRDYRFYERDFMHPNAMATDYIWERFQEIYFTESSIEKVKAAFKISRDLNHRNKSEIEVNNPGLKKRIEEYLERYK
ncbi:MAG: GSCFA domain-containing protein [Flavobacteriales bacterium]|nr:GSCFA domain-containing protein [Flavobacteriales bacterium]